MKTKKHKWDCYHHLTTARQFHNNLVNLLSSYEAAASLPFIQEELDQLHRLTDLIADKIFPHNHEQ